MGLEIWKSTLFFWLGVFVRLEASEILGRFGAKCVENPDYWVLIIWPIGSGRWYGEIFFTTKQNATN
jgi:hypothetical protein